MRESPKMITEPEAQREPAQTAVGGYLGPGVSIEVRQNTLYDGTLGKKEDD